MFDSLTVQAPAKINIGLRVMPRRADGYHDIKSIFTTVNLCDEITITLTDKKGTCLVECEQMVLPEENTFTAAYKAFCVLTGTDCGCKVKVTKRIPSGGGLGGGSSDASSFIQSIDTLLGTHLSAKEFDSLAGIVGSDCYFFTQALAGRRESSFQPFAAVVGGRGEKVEAIAARTDYSVLLVFPGVSVSTKEAYLLVDETISSRYIDAEDDYINLYRKPVHEWSFVNDFTAPVCVAFPQVAEALAAVKRSGASFADMSGSGSTVFGVFEGRERALQAQEVLSKRWKIVLVLAK